MAGPYITIDLEKIEHNARAITGLCAKHGIQVTGVTKVTCGIPQAAKAMLRGGCVSIGESRMKNILRLKANGVNSRFMLLRIPPLSAVEEIVTSVDISLNSELSVITALSKAAEERGLIHQIILMVDLGDLREGIWPNDLMMVVREVVELEGIRIVGLGTNLSCYGGVVPTEDNMAMLADYASQIERRFNVRLRYISGGNSSSLNLIASGNMPKKVNHIRIGEAILLGRETVHRKPWPNTYQDAFIMNAEVIELKNKPSVPIGETSEDAFGHKPVFEDKGDMRRAILNIGREDVDIEGISPTEKRLSVLGASSDHLLVDVTGARDDIHLGDDIGFTMNYAALLAAMTSGYVEKRPLRHGHIEYPHKGVMIIGPGAISNKRDSFETMVSAMIPGFEKLGIPLVQKEASDVSVSEGPLSEKLDQVIRFAEKTAEHVEKGINEDYFPVILGLNPGDSLGVYLGLARLLNPPGLVVFSAFGGFQFPGQGQVSDKEENRTLSRIILGAALGYGDEKLAACGGIKPKFEPENVAIVGLREADSEEAEWITRSRIKTFTMEDIDSLGMREVTYRAIRAAGMGTTGVHITLDMSVLDPIVAPAVPKPVRGGISYREAHLAMEMIAKSGLLRSVDVVGLDPEKDSDFSTAKLCAEFVLSLFGKKILGR